MKTYLSTEVKILQQIKAILSPTLDQITDQIKSGIYSLKFNVPRVKLFKELDSHELKHGNTIIESMIEEELIRKSILTIKPKTGLHDEIQQIDESHIRFTNEHIDIVCAPQLIEKRLDLLENKLKDIQ